MLGLPLGQIVTFTFLGAALVLVMTHAKSFATATGAVADLWTRETAVLSGSGYVGAQN